MWITGIRVWRVALPLHEGCYSWPNDDSVDAFDRRAVAVDNDAGMVAQAARD